MKGSVLRRILFVVFQLKMTKVHQGSGMLKSILGHSINVKVKMEVNGSKQGH